MSEMHNKDPYDILGVARGASDEEIKNAYRALVKKYHPDNYTEDTPLTELAKEKMQEINWAYDEIQRIRHDARTNSYTGNRTYYASSGQGYNQGGAYGAGNGESGAQRNIDPIYIEIREDINKRRFADAERKLLSILPVNRVAEWHYLISLVLMSRNSIGDAMRELEIACSMDPGNFEYQKAKEMFNTNVNGYQNTYYGSANTGSGYNRRRSDADQACDCCTNLICLDCLCECMGGDLIACC